MHKRTVADVMTRTVVTARPDTGFAELVRLMTEHSVSALPVTDASGGVVGVVSEADLLAKESARADGAPHSLRALLRRHADKSRAAGTVAAELMSSPAVTTTEHTPVTTAARLMSEHRVKRLPVVTADGVLTGVVSRSDLLGVFLRGDDAIAEEIRHEVFERSLDTPADRVGVTVHDGQVTLDGTVERRSWVPIAAALSERVDGVVSVHNRLGWSWDDTGVTIPEAMVVDIRHEPRP
ncbi:CBS domain-containing protein [Actinokineospora sp. UTMC 2448]|uniref:CBS domain-containing protein n=1 Tax=Actinokineospora sp. UTMC 2448 TaxID=2268449 RepID=UPI002164439D|nr:CBS domain-containing protein [Actinokineospora sp. UTMC 2448]UVS79453.1 Inosine-5'-monophosphate dehydrogenase [Actinokineospora sp. UTMC 2448]